MHALEELEQQFHLMALEVSKQVDDTRGLLASPDEATFEKILSRDDHIDNFKSVIENTCFSRLLSQASLEKADIDFTRAVNIISNNLERVSDYSVRIVQRTRFLSSSEFLKQFDYDPLFRHILDALALVTRSLFHRDISMALRICRTESILDQLYKKTYAEIIDNLKSGEKTNDLVATLFIFRYLERMGDALLNIGEAVIFSVVGEKLKIDQYQALRESLADLGVEAPMREVDFESIWGTRSGCRIGKVSDTGRRATQPVIFKEGRLRKILEERLSIQTWESIEPGLTPKVVGFHEGGENASLLLELIPGKTLQEILLGDDDALIRKALLAVERTCNSLWLKTMKNRPVHIGYMEQLFSRLDDVLLAHPHLGDGSNQASSGPASTTSLFERLEEIEKRITAPFSVFIHGDFNTNNMIFDPNAERLHYIDVHRSRDDDYVQDVSVFLVSNFRMPLFEVEPRGRLNSANVSFLSAARELARWSDDSTFEARLCLGLIRSLVTSTRFELNSDFASEMFSRALQLARALLSHSDQPWDTFEVPDSVIVFDQTDART